VKQKGVKFPLYLRRTGRNGAMMRQGRSLTGENDKNWEKVEIIGMDYIESIMKKTITRE